SVLPRVFPSFPTRRSSDLGRVLVLPWIVWLVIFSSLAFLQYVLAVPLPMSLRQFVILWTLIAAGIDLLLWFTIRTRFLRDFRTLDRKSTRLNFSHQIIPYA